MTRAMDKFWIRIGEDATPTERAAADSLVRRLDLSAEVVVGKTLGDTDGPGIVLGTPTSSEEIRKLEGGVLRDIADLGAEGFAITTVGPVAFAAANEPRGLVYAAGWLLRETGVVHGRWQPPASEVRDKPRLAVRNIYFADHMGNWYTHAAPEAVFDYVEEMALWGYNELTTVLAVRPGETFFDAVARLHELEDHARLFGMTTGTVVQSNTSFDRPRDEWKAEPGPIPGAYDVCPSQPGAWEFLVEDKRQYLELMQPFDFLCLWPYDGGGCYSASCAPWARTFLKLSHDIARAASSGAEVRVSAWFFERDVAGEDDALFAYLADEPDWFRYIVAGAVETRRWIADGRSIPEPYQVLLFPDVSMFDGIPWGGRGANPAPLKFARELTDARTMLAGAMVYSEGRYDDLNKVLWARLLWDPDLDPGEVISQYCRFYFGEGEQATPLILDIERGMEGLPDTERWRREIFHPEWDVRAQEIENDLDRGVAKDWRWRMLRAKTRIEAAYSALNENGRGSSDRTVALQTLRETYDHLQSDLNLHDPERSLPTWFYAPLDEAFPATSKG